MMTKTREWHVHPLAHGSGLVYRFRMVPCTDDEGETGTVMKPEWVYDPWLHSVLTNANRRFRDVV